MSSGLKFVIADDHPLFRGALKQALSGLDDQAQVLEAGDVDATRGIVAANDISGTFGAVSSTHWLGTSVGMSVLERGGTAFDAAAACGFT